MACTKLIKGEKEMGKWKEQMHKYIAMLIIFVMAFSWIPTYGYATEAVKQEVVDDVDDKESGHQQTGDDEQDSSDQSSTNEKNEQMEQEDQKEEVTQTSSAELKSLVQQSIQDSVGFYKNHLPTYDESNIGSHSDFWVYAALWSAGVKDLKKDLAWPENAHPWATFTYWSQGKNEPSTDANENAGIIIGSKLLGLNPTSFGNQNAVEDLLALQRENGMFSTIWGEAWALIALDLVDEQYDQEKQIASMLKAQNANGVFGDTDATGWTLLALAPYMHQPAVQKAIDQAVDYIHKEYKEHDEYPGMFGPNANTTAAVVMGLAAVGEDLYSDKWNQSSGSLLEDLLEYQQDNGSFWWKKDSAGAYLMATEQVLLALATVEAGQSTFQQMKSQLVEQPDVQPEEKPTVNTDELQIAVDEAQKVETSKLTDQSKKQFEAALEAALNLLENDAATQEEIDDAARLLEEVRSNLKERAPPVKVNVRVETHEKTLVKTLPVEVEPFDLKEYINHQNNGQSVLHEEARAIHAIIRALETVDGLDLKDDEQFGLSSAGNYIQKVGKDGEFTSGFLSGWMYFVNNEFAPVGVADFKLTDGDSIVMYYTPNFTDSTFSWFENETYEAEVGKPVQLSLLGDHSTKGAHLLIDEKPYTVNGELELVDENGHITAVFDKPGTFHVTANRENDEGERNIVRPYTVINVIEKEEVPEEAPEESTEDVEPPKLKIKGLKDGETITKPTVQFTVEAIDEVDGEVPIVVSLNGKELKGQKAVSYTVTLNEGKNTILIRAKDQAGNEVKEQFTVYYEPPQLEEAEAKALKDVVEYLLAQDVTSEWEAITLAQAGYKIPSSYRAYFDEKIESEIKNGLENGRFKITDAERLALGALALGETPTNVNDVNLIELIYNSPDRHMWDGTVEDTMTFQGNNGLAFALIALDADAFDVPNDAKWTREKLVDALIKAQRDDGAWNLNDAYPNASIDVTAMVMTALAPYTEQPKVKESIDHAVSYLSSIQTDEGGFDGGDFVGGITSEATSQVIIALTANGIDPTSEQFTKSQNLLEHLLTFQHTDGGFYHTLGESVSNNMATEQASNALVAYEYFVTGKGSLYNFVKKNDEETPENPEENDGTEESEDDTDNEDSKEEQDDEAEGGESEEGTEDEETEAEQEDGREDEESDNQLNNDSEEIDSDNPSEGDTTEEHQQDDSTSSKEASDNPSQSNVDKETSGNTLPKTATTLFNSLLFGVSLLSIGIVLFIRNRKTA